MSPLRMKPGSSGSSISVITNSFPVTTIPQMTFVHYDLGFPSLKIFPKRERALEIVDRLQLQEANQFNPRAVYDGQRNMFRSIPLDLPNNAGTFTVYMGDAPQGRHKNARGVDVRITKVATIDPHSIKAVIDGNGSHSPQSLTTMTLLNVLIRMQPIMTHPSNARSFFTKNIRENLGKGLELWRGLFQSVRPTIGRLLINVDIATAVMYNSGPLIDLLLTFIGGRDPRDLVPSNLTQKKNKINQFLKGLLLASSVPPRPGKPARYKKFKNIVMTGADHHTFTNDRTGETLSVSEHLRRTYNFTVKFGKIICVEFPRGVVYPIEVLMVKEGQMYKKTLPPALAPRALKFATQRPQERIQAIQNGAGLLGYTQSDYLRYSGMTIDPRLINIKARILSPPPIQWGGSQHPAIPNDGAWNVVGKRFFKAAAVKAWAVVLYDNHIERQRVEYFLRSFVETCSTLGMYFPNHPPPIIDGRPQGGEKVLEDDMNKAGMAAVNTFRAEFEKNPRPTFILVILPDSAIDIRTSVKSWGDCVCGVPTQCMKREKLLKANNQYCNNLALKVNTKIGGINSIPSSAGNPQSNRMIETMQWLSQEPTMIIGADVSHAAPDSNRPSVTGLVSSVDEHFCQYVASCEVQTPRKEMIEDLPKMLEHAVNSFCLFWKVMRGRSGVVPRRIIFYRDGVSEGQFDDVGHEEVNAVKARLAQIWKDKNFGTPPKLTFIIVAKNHHVRFFPQSKNEGDRSGNCRSGLVVDQEITSPVHFDFYLQSHGGLLGTSRPSHYSVIEDGNSLDANKLQEISYALCHVYARATRSVSIPAPVYYADIVCARGRFHSKLIRDGGDTSSEISRAASLEQHKEAFRGLAESMKYSMYFM